ncbi:periplasmic nitrate reductase, NapE protein (plasmid) [Cupriavidus necator H16]|uniref:Periplasmic nitrate reductase accessory protein n=2 Tax=Cupriavidus necator (strain ATCC 17699 / DSM 428 / KCTC 22496 / NCIMB 10442 / H16 / Stanier 337) TaxID=381666 RepID=Q7WXC5_CUPNH|nr:periplasmic nitrate reductase accessory protein [Cupriavidus necator H16]
MMESGEVHDPQRKKEELRSFLFLTAVMVPVLSVIVVAGYGFIVWMSQLVGGPPSH